MNDSTSILNFDSKLSSEVDKSVTGLNFDGNKKIFYLPVLISQKFPNLIAYTASNCSIDSISKENFQDLKKLKILYLHENEIQTLTGNVFEDLESLEELLLGN